MSLLLVYGTCLDDGEDIANTRIDAALKAAYPFHVYPTTSGVRPASGGIWLHGPDMEQGRQGVPEPVTWLVAGVIFEAKPSRPPPGRYRQAG